MELKQIFYGKVTNGKLKLFNRNKFDEFLKFLEGMDIMLTIGKKQKPRSGKQNKYYRGVVIKLLGDHFGYDTNEYEDLHRSLREMFLGTYQRGPFTVIRSTTGLSTVEMEDYLESIRRWAAQEYGIVIASPNEVDYEQYPE